MPEIEHVVVLALENRSFDHMLGFLDHPDEAYESLRDQGDHGNPPWGGGADVRPEATAKPVLPVDPDHSHAAVLEQLALDRRRPTNRGFVVSYERKGRGLAPPSFGGLLGPLLNWWTGRKAAAKAPIAGRGPLIMRCQPPERVPALSALAREFAVCTRWFCSVPGETWPNRNFMHAGTSDGETGIDIRPFNDRTIFEVLEEHDKSWHVYHDDTPQIWAFPKLWTTPERHARWYPLADFADHVAAGRLPAYSFLEPNHRPPIHVPGARGASDSQHPGNNIVTDDDYDGRPDMDAATDFARGEALIARVYEALRSAPEVFARTVLLITYDEHGGFYDHVPPPAGVPAPGDPVGRLARFLDRIYSRRAAAFDFTMLGPRVPAVVVSPRIPKGTIDAEVRDHASVPATLRAIFAPGAEPLTRRDAWARPFHTSLTLDEPRDDLPDLSAHTGTAAPAIAGEPAMAGEPAGAGEPAVNGEPAAAGEPAVTGEPETTPPVPSHYADFVAQGDLVRRTLDEVEEPEAAGLAAEDPGARRAVDISAAFAEAALRHRT